MLNTKEDFRNLGFIVIRNLLDKNEVTRLYDYTLKISEHGNKEDTQVPGSPSFYQDKEVAFLQKKFLPQIEAAIQTKLLAVFCYNRIYRKGAVLRAHKDSSRAQISASINLGQQGDPWSLWLLDYNETAHEVILQPGDALIYYGQKLMHWRETLSHSDFVSQIMFHFVPKSKMNTLIAHNELIRKIRKRCRQLMGVAY